MSDSPDVIKAIEAAQDSFVSLATGGGQSYEDYEKHRSNLVSEPLLQGRLPVWLIKCRWGSQFWSFMKATSPTYQGRREFLWEHFGKVLDFVEHSGVELASLTVEQMLQVCNSETIAQAWKRCCERRENDPEGAITSARAMLESTCKHILDELGEQYSGKEDLPKLYKKTASALSLSPDQHNEQIFKQILGGCGSVVTGLASLRNAFGDAHGKGQSPARPSPRHAELAINLSGSISSFLLSTFEQRKK